MRLTKHPLPKRPAAAAVGARAVHLWYQVRLQHNVTATLLNISRIPRHLVKTRNGITGR